MSDSLPIFVHSALDDYGLNPVQFRVYGHIARRSGGDDGCFESLPKMARFLGIHADTLKPAIKLLVDRRLLSRIDRSGQTSVFRIAPIPGWKFPPGGKIQGGEKTNLEGVEKFTLHPPENFTPKGSPLKLTPLKLLPSDPTPEQIYESYPRKVGKPGALKAIKKALKKIPAPKLLEATRQYALARSGEDENFTPHPATWFNGERYDDSPVTWANSNANQKQKPDHEKGF